MKPSEREKDKPMQAKQGKFKSTVKENVINVSVILSLFKYLVFIFIQVYIYIHEEFRNNFYVN